MTTDLLFRGNEADVDALLCFLVDQVGDEFEGQDIPKRGQPALDALLSLRCVEEVGEVVHFGVSDVVFRLTNRGRRFAQDTMENKTEGYQRYVAWCLRVGIEPWFDDEWAAAEAARVKERTLRDLAAKTKVHGFLNHNRHVLTSLIAARSGQLYRQELANHANPLFGLL